MKTLRSKLHFITIILLLCLSTLFLPDSTHALSCRFPPKTSYLSCSQNNCKVEFEINYYSVGGVCSALPKVEEPSIELSPCVTQYLNSQVTPTTGIIKIDDLKLINSDNVCNEIEYTVISNASSSEAVQILKNEWIATSKQVEKDLWRHRNFYSVTILSTGIFAISGLYILKLFFKKRLSLNRVVVISAILQTGYVVLSYPFIAFSFPEHYYILNTSYIIIGVVLSAELIYLMYKTLKRFIVSKK